MVAQCLEVDVVDDPGHDAVQVHHPPQAATGFTLRDVLDLAAPGRTGVWIDAKDLDLGAGCERVARDIERTPRHGEVMFEFPPSSLAVPAAQGCAARLRALGVRRSYYVPTDSANTCAFALRGHRGSVPACDAVRQAVERAVASGLYTDLSFDFDGVEAMQAIPSAVSLRWNTWNLRAEQTSDGRLKSFGMVLLDASEDVNHY